MNLLANEYSNMGIITCVGVNRDVIVAVVINAALLVRLCEHEGDLTHDQHDSMDIFYDFNTYFPVDLSRQIIIQIKVPYHKYRRLWEIQRSYLCIK